MTSTAAPLVTEAEALARRLLTGDSDRLAHCRYAAGIAHVAADALGIDDGDSLVAAAWLHDIGYVPTVARTGFHPLDGALYLAALGWPDDTVLLVAHHSHAVLLAPYFGVDHQLSLLDRLPPAREDVLTYADLRSGATGMGALAEERIAEMRARHAVNTQVPAEVREARYALLLASANRVSQALRAQPAGWIGRRRTRATSRSGSRLTD